MTRFAIISALALAGLLIGLGWAASAFVGTTQELPETADKVNIAAPKEPDRAPPIPPTETPPVDPAPAPVVEPVVEPIQEPSSFTYRPVELPPAPAAADSLPAACGPGGCPPSQANGANMEQPAAKSTSVEYRRRGWRPLQRLFGK